MKICGILQGLTWQLVNGFPNGRHVKHPYGTDSLNHKNKHARTSFINLTFLIQLNNKSSVKIMFVLGHYEFERFTEDKWDIINMNMLCF